MENKITLDTGSGGRKMQKLIRETILKYVSFNHGPLEDSAVLNKLNNDIAFTTDSFVVDPIFFPGGDIGKLSVYGTVNDLSVSGAEPLYLSLSFIIEEGFELINFEKIIESINDACIKANVKIVTGDTKVVPKGKCDKIFINTSGIGNIITKSRISEVNLKKGDRIIVSGNVGEHGASIIAARGEFHLETELCSDLYPLNLYTVPLFKKDYQISAMRDITRGGLATVLNEFAIASNCMLEINEKDIPFSNATKGIADILGLDPLYFACEGAFIAAVDSKDYKVMLEFMHDELKLKDSRVIGEVIDTGISEVNLKTEIGGVRILSMLEGEQYPRIC